MRELDWAEAHCAASWFANGVPRLADRLQGLLDQKKMRAKESYDIVNLRGALTGMSHLLPHWPSPEEQEPTSKLISNANTVAARLDTTANHTWTDRGMSSAWEQYQSRSAKCRILGHGQTLRKRVENALLARGCMTRKTTRAIRSSSRGPAILPACSTQTRHSVTWFVSIWFSPATIECGRRRPRLCAFRKDVNPPMNISTTGTVESKMMFPDTISARNERAYVKRACRWYFIEKI